MTTLRYNVALTLLKVRMIGREVTEGEREREHEEDRERGEETVTSLEAFLVSLDNQHTVKQLYSRCIAQIARAISRKTQRPEAPSRELYRVCEG